MLPGCVGQFCCMGLFMTGYSGDSGDFVLKC